MLFDAGFNGLKGLSVVQPFSLYQFVEKRLERQQQTTFNQILHLKGNAEIFCELYVVTFQSKSCIFSLHYIYFMPAITGYYYDFTCKTHYLIKYDDL